mgnify:CR=1 FL=1
MAHDVELARLDKIDPVGEWKRIYREVGKIKKWLNALPALLPKDAGFADFVKVIDVPATTGGRVLELVMSGDEGRAVAFLTRPRNA